MFKIICTGIILNKKKYEFNKECKEELKALKHAPRGALNGGLLKEKIERSGRKCDNKVVKKRNLQQENKDKKQKIRK